MASGATRAVSGLPMIGLLEPEHGDGARRDLADGARAHGLDEAVAAGNGEVLGEGAHRGLVAGADLGGAGGQHQRGLALPRDRLEARGDRHQRAVALDEVVDRAGGLRVLPASGKIAASPAERSSSTEP